MTDPQTPSFLPFPIASPAAPIIQSPPPTGPPVSYVPPSSQPIVGYGQQYPPPQQQYHQQYLDQPPHVSPSPYASPPVIAAAAALSRPPLVAQATPPPAAAVAVAQAPVLAAGGHGHGASVKLLAGVAHPVPIGDFIRSQLPGAPADDVAHETKLLTVAGVYDTAALAMFTPSEIAAWGLRPAARKALEPLCRSDGGSLPAGAVGVPVGTPAAVGQYSAIVVSN